jgi:glutathione synthase
LASGAYGKDTKISRDNLPDNPAAKNIAKGLAKAHEIYDSPESAIILFVVQDPERNIFDQRWIEYLLLEDYNIQIHRMTLEEISSQAKVENHRLYVPRMGAMYEISVVYYRCGYGPEDYLSESQWKARHLLEISMAIKCPNILAQLTTCKKVQQALTMPNALERYPFRKSITLT